MTLIVLGTFKEVSIYISFKINQKYIAANLCVERELVENAYNHGHKVMTIQNEHIRFSTIFRDWLMINYVRD